MGQEGKWLLCRMDDIWYGLDLAQVQEIIYRPVVTRLPTMGRSVAGMMEWLGQQVAVVDIGDDWQGRTASAIEDSRQVVVLKEDGSAIGLLVDEVGEIISKGSGQQMEIDPLLRSSVKAVQDAFSYKEEVVFAIDPRELFSAVR